jgi:hypothetical protein
MHGQNKNSFERNFSHKYMKYEKGLIQNIPNLSLFRGVKIFFYEKV